MRPVFAKQNGIRGLVATILILAALLFPLAGQAAVYTWATTPAFPTGPTPGNSVSAVYSGLGAVTLTNNKDPSTGTGGVWQSGYPSVDNSTTTGGGSVNGLQLYMASQPTVNSSITVSIVFGYTGGATNVSLVIWDVDAASNFTDKLANISGVTLAGTTIAATSVVGSTENQVTGSGTITATATGTDTASNNTNAGNVTITFGTTAIRSVQFTWYNSNPTTRTTQVIGVSPITFTPVGSATPEVGTSFAALGLCASVVGYGTWRRRRNRAA